MIFAAVAGWVAGGNDKVTVVCYLPITLRNLAGNRTKVFSFLSAPLTAKSRSVSV